MTLLTESEYLLLNEQTRDFLEYRAQTLAAPADAAALVTPNDTVDLATTTRAILCTVAGNVKISLADSGTVTIPVLAGVVYPLQVKRVFSTDTTATIVALW